MRSFQRGKLSSAETPSFKKKNGTALQKVRNLEPKNKITNVTPSKLLLNSSCQTSNFADCSETVTATTPLLPVNPRLDVDEVGENDVDWS